MARQMTCSTRWWGTLLRRRLRVRLIDAAPTPTSFSQAIAIQTRTMESFGLLGLADDIMAAGVALPASPAPPMPPIPLPTLTDATNAQRRAFGIDGANAAPLVIRPDGYLGLRAQGADIAAALRAYTARTLGAHAGRGMRLDIQPDRRRAAGALPMRPSTTPPAGYSFAPLQPGSPYFADAVRLYLDTWPGDERGITDFFTRYAALPDYHGLVALHEGALVGFGFGVRSLPGNWWHDRVAAHVGRDHPALQDAWTLMDLAVAPGHRGKGIGGALMEALLAAQPCPRALLSTEVYNVGARRLYERHGWSYLHPGFAFNPGGIVYVIMRRELASDE